MISISKPQGAEQAKGYLSKESYYQQNSELGYWHGSDLALESLGLSDAQPIDKKSYAAVLDGVHPISGKHFLINSATSKRRAGIDVTFSAPKSVSILMELSENLGEKAIEHSIRSAHEEAVQYAMDQISRHYAKTRIRKGRDKRETVNTHAVWASFQHDTTRETGSGEIDPQLHTHNFLMALTFYEDPISGVVKPYAMSNEEIYANKMYLGQIYRNALAKNLGQLGLEIEVTDIEQGFFELQGFSKDQLEAFSGRREELMDKLALVDMRSQNRAKLLDTINAKTKKNKRKIDRDALLSHNQNRMRAVGIDKPFLERIVARSITASLPTLSKEAKKMLLLEHLHKSLDLLEEHHSVFGYEDIMKNALKLGLGYGLILEDYQAVFIKIMEQGRLLRLDENIYSTNAIVEAERNVIASIIQGKEALKPFVEDERKIDRFIDANYSNMTQGQRDMLSGVLGTKDQFMVVQGDAGTGKTYAVSAIREYLSAQSETAQIVGLAFTGKAAQSLEDEGGISASTLHSFLYKEEKRQTNIPKKRLLIVDEAGMAGSLQISRLIEIAKRNGDKIVFIGDTKQFSSIAAGNIFLDMQRYGAKTIYMSEAKRQKSDHAKGIVRAVKARQIDEAMDILEERGSFVEMDQDEAIEIIAQNYSDIYPMIDPLADELIIASRNMDRIKINARIRETLGKAGSGEEHMVKELVSQNGVGRYFTKGLKEGMIIIPSKVPMTKNGAEYRIKSIIDDRHIEIEAMGGQSVVIDFYQYTQQCQIYMEVQKEFAPGDTIIFTKNANITQDSKVKNGERAVIKSIKDGVIETANGKKINLQEMNFVDYGYAITDFKSQGATTKNVTIFADAQMASMESFYTQVTRAKENIMIYTSNKEEMMANLTKAKKRQSTLAYTAKDIEVVAKIQTKRELADTFRGAGGNLTVLQGRLEKAVNRLGLTKKEKSRDRNTASIFENINSLIQKIELVADKLKMKIEQRWESIQEADKATKSVHLEFPKMEEEKQTTHSSIKMRF